ncbi:MAG: LysR family transcriptional regulator [Pseudomonadota bacterium]
MHMLDIAHWSLICALKDQDTLSSAAASLGITQSAATQRLREAERRLGVALAQKNGRSLELTDAGETVARAGQSSLPLMRQAESDAIWQGKRNTRQLTLALGHFDPPGLSMHLIRLFQDALPGVSVQLARMANEQLISAIAGGKADLAFLPGSPANPDIPRRFAASDRLVAIFPKGDGPCAGETVAPLHFAGKTFLTYGLRPEPGWEYDLFFERGKSFPGKAVKIESTELICQMVSQGLGASILPSVCIAASAHAADIDIAEFGSDQIRFDWFLIHARTAPAEAIDVVGEAFTTLPDTKASG